MTMSQIMILIVNRMMVMILPTIMNGNIFMIMVTVLAMVMLAIT